MITATVVVIRIRRVATVTVGGAGRWWHALSHVARPHSHDAADRVDTALEASADGIRTLWISFGVLAVTTVVQVVVVVVLSGRWPCWATPCTTSPTP